MCGMRKSLTFLMHCRALSRSKYFDVTDPGMTGMKGVLYCSLAVRDRAPIVRPWKAPEKQTTSVAALLSVLYGSSPAAHTAKRSLIDAAGR